MATETYSLTVEGSIFGQRMKSVLHFIGTGITADETLLNGQSLCSLFDAVFMPEWLACCSLVYGVDRITARRVSAKPSAEAYINYNTGSQAGTLASETQSNELRPSVFLVPPMGVKSGGRIFMPSAASESIIENSYAPAYLASIDTLMVDMLTAHVVTGGTWELAIFSRKLAVSHFAMAYSLSPAFGFQKRSKRFV